MRVLTIIGLLLAGACMPLPGPQVGSPLTANSGEAPPVRQALPALSTALDIEAAARGLAIARTGCSSCHAIDASGDSPLAVAPPFRDVVKRRSSDDLSLAFERGLVTTHPAMPAYVFRASEIHDLTAYLDALRDGVHPVTRP